MKPSQALELHREAIIRIRRYTEGLDRQSFGAREMVQYAVLFLPDQFPEMREGVVLGDTQPTVVADLGHGVMDAAMVEAAAYCLERWTPA